MQQRQGESVGSVPIPASLAPSLALRRLTGLWRAACEQLEAERSRWVLWLPVMLALGIGSFFALPAEPAPWVRLVLAGIAMALAGLVALAQWRRREPVSVEGALLLGLAAACVGAALAHQRLLDVAAPVLERPGIYRVEGRIIELAPRPDGSRMLLDEIVLVDQRRPVDVPARLRVNLRERADDLRPGQRVRVLARLQPPLPPALPGAFDYGRQAYFEQLGAVGFALGAAEGLREAEDPGRYPVETLRRAIADRVMEVSPGASGAVGAALIAGVRAGIDAETWRQMQVSGLAHLLSVSGLHMALVAGGTFSFCRLLLALVPALALRFPVKKLAAVIATAAGAGYLLLSGASVPTQRSFLMLAVAFLAVILDRNPFSVRLLAWAALFVLVYRPESLLGASFQLSFAAVLGLILAYEAWQQRSSWRGARREGWLGTVSRYLLGVTATTLIATAATTPLAAFHFQTVPTYGILANLVAVPLTSFIVMPAGLLGLLAMPLGLDGPAFAVMALGTEGVLATARLMAELPGAAILVSRWPADAMLLLALGSLWLGLWQRPWRWLGLLPVLAAVALVAAHRPPDLLVDRALGMAAVRQPDGQVALIEWDPDRLTRETWLRYLGVATVAPPPVPGAGPAGRLRCDHVGCVVDLGKRRLLLARRVEAVAEDCGAVDIVIARVGVERCPGSGILVDSRALHGSAGLSVTMARDRLDVRTIAKARGDWPWTRLGGRPRDLADADNF